MRFAILLLLALVAMPAMPQSVASRMCRQADGSLRWQDGSAPCPTLSAPGGGSAYSTMAPVLGSAAFQFGQLLGKMLMDSGASAQQQAAQRQADQAALARAAAQEEQRKEAVKNRLLAMMMTPGGSGPMGFQTISDAERPQFTFDEDAFAPRITQLPPGSASAQLSQAAYFSEQAAQAKSDEDAAALADAAFNAALGVPGDLPVPNTTRALKLPDSDTPRLESTREAYRDAAVKDEQALAELAQARQREQASRQALEQAKVQLDAAHEAFMKAKRAQRKAQQVEVAHKEAAMRDAEREAQEKQRLLADAQAAVQKAQGANEAAARAVFDMIDFIRSLAKRPDSAYRRGVEEGASCLAANAGLFCAAHPEASCEEKYMLGYRVGQRAMQNKLEEAHRIGQETKSNGGSSFVGFSHPKSGGTCRVQWLEAFNSGYFGAPFTMVGK